MPSSRRYAIDRRGHAVDHIDHRDPVATHRHLERSAVGAERHVPRRRPRSRSPSAGSPPAPRSRRRPPRSRRPARRLWATTASAAHFRAEQNIAAARRDDRAVAERDPRTVVAESDRGSRAGCTRVRSSHVSRSRSSSAPPSTHATVPSCASPPARRVDGHWGNLGRRRGGRLDGTRLEPVGEEQRRGHADADDCDGQEGADESSLGDPTPVGVRVAASARHPLYGRYPASAILRNEAARSRRGAFYGEGIGSNLLAGRRARCPSTCTRSATPLTGCAG